MSDIRKRFHELALKSGLFKGRSDLYYCYLKSEKIAHVIILLSERSVYNGQPQFQDLIDKASLLPQIMVRFAAGQTNPEGILADLFGTLTSLRLCSTLGFISKENSAILEGEYEQLIEKISAGNLVSPFLSSEEFSLPELPQDDIFLTSQSLISSTLPSSNPQRVIKDINKGQLKGHQKVNEQQAKRTSAILEIVLKNKGVSIKDIVAVVKDCSEKTIQRELAALVEKGLIRKQGERRWSIYLPA
jgi:predicted transcriptional regulator